MCREAKRLATHAGWIECVLAERRKGQRKGQRVKGVRERLGSIELRWNMKSFAVYMVILRGPEYTVSFRKQCEASRLVREL